MPPCVRPASGSEMRHGEESEDEQRVDRPSRGAEAGALGCSRHRRHAVRLAHRPRRRADQARKPARRNRSPRPRRQADDRDDGIHRRSAQQGGRPPRAADPAHRLRHTILDAALHPVCAAARAQGQGRRHPGGHHLRLAGGDPADLRAVQDPVLLQHAVRGRRLRPQRVLHRLDPGPDRQPHRRLRPEELGQEGVHHRGRLQLRPHHRELDDEVHEGRGWLGPRHRLLPPRRHQLLLGHQPHPAGPARSRPVGPGRRQPFRLLPAMGCRRHEVQDPGGIERVRPRRRTHHDGPLDHERDHHLLRLVQQPRHARDQGLRLRDAGEVRRGRDRPERTRYRHL